MESSVVSDLVARLRQAPDTYQFVNSRIGDERFPFIGSPSLVDARLDVLNASYEDILATLKRDGRRSAVGAEILLYALEAPEQFGELPIFGFGQVTEISRKCFGDLCSPEETAIVLYLEESYRMVGLVDVRLARGGCRTLSFPMTPAELAQRDAEDAAGRTA